MITDPNRARRSDPGNPDICNVFDFHKLYTDKAVVERIDRECRTAQIGCVDCKKIMAQSLTAALEPIRKQRAFYEAYRPDTVLDVIAAGRQKASGVARQTMEEVRQAIRI